jgi:hypothetical protein
MVQEHNENRWENADDYQSLAAGILAVVLRLYTCVPEADRGLRKALVDGRDWHATVHSCTEACGVLEGVRGLRQH